MGLGIVVGIVVDNKHNKIDHRSELESEMGHRVVLPEPEMDHRVELELVLVQHILDIVVELLVVAVVPVFVEGALGTFAGVVGVVLAELQGEMRYPLELGFLFSWLLLISISLPFRFGETRV